MRPDRVLSLAQFLSFLTASTEVGDGVVRALVLGGLAPLNVAAGNLYLNDGNGSIALVGSHGFSPEELDDFRVISLSLPFPLTMAVNTREPVLVSVDGVMERYPLFQASKSARSWEAQAERIEKAELVSVPLLWQGVCIGAVGLVLGTSSRWDAADLNFIDAACNALTLWIVGRQGGQPQLPGQRSSRAGRQLTDRQRDVLRLIELGKSNAAIAAALGFSVSTVKADVASAMSTLGAADRQRASEVARELGLLD